MILVGAAMPGKIARAKLAIKNIEKQLASSPTDKQRADFLRQLKEQQYVLTRAEKFFAWKTL